MIQITLTSAGKHPDTENQQESQPDKKRPSIALRTFSLLQPAQTSTAPRPPRERARQKAVRVTADQGTDIHFPGSRFKGGRLHGSMPIRDAPAGSDRSRLTLYGVGPGRREIAIDAITNGLQIGRARG